MGQDRAVVLACRPAEAHSSMHACTRALLSAGQSKERVPTRCMELCAVVVVRGPNVTVHYVVPRKNDARLRKRELWMWLRIPGTRILSWLLGLFPLRMSRLLSFEG